MVSDVRHGTKYRYDQGCRCDECRTAKTRSRRKMRDRARAVNSPAYQRELAAARALKDRYSGTCERCGGPTSGSNGRAAAPPVCAACAPGVYGPRYAAQLRGRGPTVARVLDFMGDGVEHRFMEIARGCGVSSDHVGQILIRLRRFGLVVRVRRGVYKKAEVADV